MSDRGRICPVPPDDDEPVACLVFGFVVLAVAVPGCLLVVGAIFGLIAQCFGASFEAMN